MLFRSLGLKTLVLGYTTGSELPVGGVITTTNVVENYPGFAKISGLVLAKEIEKHARSYDLVTIKHEKAIEVKKQGKEFLVKTEKSEYNSKTILFATGTKWKKLDIPGSEEFDRRGVNYCALCDAPLYKNKVVAVVGGSDTSAKETLLLAEYAKKVYIIHRGKDIHPEQINFERIKKNRKIEIINNTNIKEIKGDFRTDTSGGTLIINDKTFLENVAKQSNQPLDIIVESFRNYNYNNGIVKLSAETGNLVMDLKLEGKSGKRSLAIILHDFNEGKEKP